MSTLRIIHVIYTVAIGTVAYELCGIPKRDHVVCYNRLSFPYAIVRSTLQWSRQFTFDT